MLCKHDLASEYIMHQACVLGLMRSQQAIHVHVLQATSLAKPSATSLHTCCTLFVLLSASRHGGPLGVLLLFLPVKAEKRLFAACVSVSHVMARIVTGP